MKYLSHHYVPLNKNYYFSDLQKILINMLFILGDNINGKLLYLSEEN